MPPNQLKPESFESYPPEARRLARERVVLLRQLPLAFLPLLLRELIEYDWKFPVERRELDQQLKYLAELPPGKLHTLVEPFARLQVSIEIEALDWVSAPGSFRNS